MRTCWRIVAAAALVVVAGGAARAQYGEMPQWPKRPKPEPPKVSFDPKLPSLGMSVKPLPAGAGKPVVEAGCLRCHSAEIIMQQRLTESQWRANVDKMIGWGSTVSPAQKPVLVAYLAKNFGPDNKSFQPTEARPAGY
jgi:hypothetical protein